MPKNLNLKNFCRIIRRKVAPHMAGSLIILTPCRYRIVKVGKLVIVRFEL